MSINKLFNYVQNSNNMYDIVSTKILSKLIKNEIIYEMKFGNKICINVILDKYNKQKYFLVINKLLAINKFSFELIITQYSIKYLNYLLINRDTNTNNLILSYHSNSIDIDFNLTKIKILLVNVPNTKKITMFEEISIILQKFEYKIIWIKKMENEFMKYISLLKTQKLKVENSFNLKTNHIFEHVKTLIINGPLIENIEQFTSLIEIKQHCIVYNNGKMVKYKFKSKNDVIECLNKYVFYIEDC